MCFYVYLKYMYFFWPHPNYGGRYCCQFLCQSRAQAQVWMVEGGQGGSRRRTLLFTVNWVKNLISFSVHNEYEDDINPKHGPKFKLSTRDELQLVDYMNYCWEWNYPRTEAMLKLEIPHYMEVCDIPNNFKHGYLGIWLVLHVFFR